MTKSQAPFFELIRTLAHQSIGDADAEQHFLKTVGVSPEAFAALDEQAQGKHLQLLTDKDGRLAKTAEPTVKLFKHRLKIPIAAGVQAIQVQEALFSFGCGFHNGRFPLDQSVEMGNSQIAGIHVSQQGILSLSFQADKAYFDALGAVLVPAEAVLNAASLDDLKEMVRRSAPETTVHDFAGWSSGEAYDKTQTDDAIKDGDVLDLGGGNVAILMKAWPTVVVGEIEHFHRLDADMTFETVDGGKYASSAARAREVSSEVLKNMQVRVEPAWRTNGGIPRFQAKELARPEASTFQGGVAEGVVPQMHEYGFDVILKADIRVKASSPEQAMSMLRSILNSADCNAGSWPNGDPVLFEASAAPDTAPVLLSIDGEDVLDAGDYSPSPGM